MAAIIGKPLQANILANNLALAHPEAFGHNSSDMNANASPARFPRKPYRQINGSQPERPVVKEDTLKAGELQIERKTFFLTLKENPRGRFLRISEEMAGKRNSIIIPSTGLADFKKMVDEMVKSGHDLKSHGYLDAEPDGNR